MTERVSFASGHHEEPEERPRLDGDHRCLLLGRLVGPTSTPADSVRGFGQRIDSIRVIAANHQCAFEPLIDGSFLVVLAPGESPTEDVTRLARCALRIHGVWPDVPLALVSRREREGVPPADLVERGVQLLDADAGPPIRLNRTAARRLAGQFRIRDAVDGLALDSERSTLVAVAPGSVTFWGWLWGVWLSLKALLTRPTARRNR